MRVLSVMLATVALLLQPSVVRAEPETQGDRQRCSPLATDLICIDEQSYVADVCSAIERTAAHHGIPREFFARLIWQESRFDHQAVSPAGAMGIAQFMPSTAALRSLADPFDPAESLVRSAEYLSFLVRKFGNLGLAAAAYNGGEGRVGRYLGGSGGVAAETRAFVSIITGRPIEYWRGEDPEELDYALHPEQPFAEACQNMAQAVPMPDFGRTPGEWQPWGVLISQNFSAEIVRNAWERERSEHEAIFGEHPMLVITVRNLSLGTRLRYSAQVGFPTRQEAQAFCTRLLEAGGNCIVQRNRDNSP